MEISSGSIWCATDRRHRGQRRQVIRTTPNSVILRQVGRGPGHHRQKLWTVRWDIFKVNYRMAGGR